MDDSYGRGYLWYRKLIVEPIDPMEKEHEGRKKPLVSCEKYDEEERKALFGEEKKVLNLFRGLG